MTTCDISDLMLGDFRIYLEGVGIAVHRIRTIVSVYFRYFGFSVQGFLHLFKGCKDLCSLNSEYCE